MARGVWGADWCGAQVNLEARMTVRCRQHIALEQTDCPMGTLGS